MNQNRLFAAALRMKSALEKYSAVDQCVQSLAESLELLLQEALAGNIVAPIPWNQVQGGYNFAERRFVDYPRIEECYADFKIEITGGEDSVLKELRVNFES